MYTLAGQQFFLGKPSLRQASCLMVVECRSNNAIVKWLGEQPSGLMVLYGSPYWWHDSWTSSCNCADIRHEAEIVEWAISQLTRALDGEATFTASNFTVQASTRCSLKRMYPSEIFNKIWYIPDNVFAGGSGQAVSLWPCPRAWCCQC